MLFEKILASRDVEAVQRQRLLMPLLVDLQPWQMAVFADIADELEKNGFEAEPFGPRTLAVKAAPVGLEGRELERMLAEVIEQTGTSGPGQSSSRPLLAFVFWPLYYWPIISSALEFSKGKEAKKQHSHIL